MHTFFEQVVEILEVLDANDGHALDGDGEALDVFGVPVEAEAVPLDPDPQVTVHHVELVLLERGVAGAVAALAAGTVQPLLN